MIRTKTSQYLEQWNGGDKGGLDGLIEEHLPWIHNHVRKRLGPFLREKAESWDFVQDAMIQFLKYGPRVLINDDDHFRALLVRIVENAIRNKNDWYTAKRREACRERPLPPDTVLVLDPPQKTVKTPSHAVDRNEREAWIRLAMEFLDPEDREVIVLRQWENESFAAIGNYLGISKDAAWLRHKRAVNRLANQVWNLRKGDYTTECNSFTA